MTIYDIVLDIHYGESGIRDFKVEAEDREEADFWVEQCTVSGKEKVLSVTDTGGTSGPS